MLLDRSAMNASQVKNVTLAAEGFQDSLRLYQSILDRQPDMWEARLGQGWALLKLGDIYKEAAKLTDAEHCYQQVILNTDMLCEQLRDQSSATELNRHAGYVLFDVLTRMRKTEEACQLAKDQSARYSENQGFFSVLVCQCQCRRDAWDEAIGRLKNIESASTQLSPTMQFEIARTHDLIANKATDAQQKTHHVSSSLDWLE
jgi:tetratricopeptide (TPR) repeat protein